MCSSGHFFQSVLLPQFLSESQDALSTKNCRVSDSLEQADRWGEGRAALGSELQVSTQTFLSVQVWNEDKKPSCRHTVLSRSQELPWRLAVPKGINRNPFGNYQLGNVIPLIVTDMKQLCFVEREQRLGLSSNKQRASCSLLSTSSPQNSRLILAKHWSN